MTKLSRVFLTVELSKVYLANLSDHGELVYVYKEIPDMWSRAFEDDVIRHFEEMNFNPTLDYFGASGIMPLSHIVLGAIVERYGVVKVLLWHSQTHSYRIKLIGG